MSKTDRALDMVVGEFDKIAMCKRGTLDTEENKREGDLWKTKQQSPYYTKKERAKVISANRKKLQNILKLKKSHDLAATRNLHTGSWHSVFTEASVDEWRNFMKDILVHPDAEAVEIHNESVRTKIRVLEEEIKARMAWLDDDLKEIKMGFITGKYPLSEFTEHLADFEAREY